MALEFVQVSCGKIRFVATTLEESICHFLGHLIQEGCTAISWVLTYIAKETLLEISTQTGHTHIRHLATAHCDYLPLRYSSTRINHNLGLDLIAGCPLCKLPLHFCIMSSIFLTMLLLDQTYCMVMRIKETSIKDKMSRCLVRLSQLVSNIRNKRRLHLRSYWPL